MKHKLSEAVTFVDMGQGCIIARVAWGLWDSQACQQVKCATK